MLRAVAQAYCHNGIESIKLSHIEAFERDVIGMMFWSPRSADDKINTALEEMQYFEYYEQSMDLIKG